MWMPWKPRKILKMIQDTWWHCEISRENRVVQSPCVPVCSSVFQCVRITGWVWSKYKDCHLPSFCRNPRQAREQDGVGCEILDLPQLQLRVEVFRRRASVSTDLQGEGGWRGFPFSEWRQLWQVLCKILLAVKIGIQFHPNVAAATWSKLESRDGDDPSDNGGGHQERDPCGDLYQRPPRQPRGSHQDEGSSARLYRARLSEGKILRSVPLPLWSFQDDPWYRAVQRDHKVSVNINTTRISLNIFVQSPGGRPASPHQLRTVCRQCGRVWSNEPGGGRGDCQGGRGPDRLHTGQLLVNRQLLYNICTHIHIYYNKIY